MYKINIWISETALYQIFIMSSLILHDAKYLKSLPDEWMREQPSPEIWRSPIDNKLYIVFATSTLQQDNGIFTYDIAKDVYIKHVSYPLDFRAECHEMCLNQLTNTLYVFSRKSFGELNLITGEWVNQYNTKNMKLPQSNLYTQSIYIYGNINEMHTFRGPRHYRFDKPNNKFVTEYDDMYYGVYICVNDIKIYNICEVCISCCDLKDQQWIEELSIETPSKLSYDVTTVNCIVVLNWIVMIFDFNTWILYYCDFSVVYDNIKQSCHWHSKSLKFMKHSTNDKGSIVLTHDKFIHIIIGSDYHSRIALSQLIPSSLCERFSKTLVFGFIHNIITDIETNVPVDIIGIISNFYV
eukprot:292764_1